MFNAIKKPCGFGGAKVGENAGKRGLKSFLISAGDKMNQTLLNADKLLSNKSKILLLFRIKTMMKEIDEKRNKKKSQPINQPGHFIYKIIFLFIITQGHF